MTGQNFLVEKDFISIVRNNKDKNFTECIINYNYNFKSKIINVLKKKFNFDMIYIYVDDIFQKNLTDTYNHIKNVTFEKSLPFYDFTKNPFNVSLDYHEMWESIRFKAFLPNPSNDWDFYELEWLMKRWSSSFGFYDYDTSFIIPTYPKDLTNNLIPSEIVLFYIKKFKKKFSIRELKTKYYPLYLFSKDKMGEELLKFFYEESIKPERNPRELIRKIHDIYHKSSNNNPFKNFLFYNNYSLPSTTKLYFDIKKYILVFLSFHSTFLCLNYVQNRKEQIFDGIRFSSKLQNHLTYFDNADSIEQEIKRIHDHHGDILTWVSRNHFKNINSKYCKYMYTNWYFVRRNINLLDIRIINYPDTQTCYGLNLTVFFRAEWVKNFHKKNYDFPERSTYKRKLKLKL